MCGTHQKVEQWGVSYESHVISALQETDQCWKPRGGQARGSAAYRESYAQPKSALTHSVTEHAAHRHTQQPAVWKKGAVFNYCLPTYDISDKAKSSK